MHAADAVVPQPNPRAGQTLRDAAQHLGAEAVVTEEDVADACDQNSRRDVTRSDYIRRILR
jgi:hypothetical protein